MSLRSAVLLLFTCFIVSSASYKILGLFPHPGKSHFDVFEPLLKALSAKGHELTVISHFPQKIPLPRYKDISLQGDTDILVDFIPLQDIPRNKFKHFMSLLMLKKFAGESCKGLRTKQLQEFSKTNETFDLIIAEMFNTDCFLGFVHKFKVPFIGLSSCTIMQWTNYRYGNPTNPSYIPNSLLGVSDDMSFLERVENTVFFYIAQFMFETYMLKPGNEEAKRYFGEDLPHLEDIANNASLLLVNSHYSLNLPRPFVPNIIEVGGMFLSKPKKIPEHIEKWINESAHGVIYFSMGSMIKGQSFPVETRKSFLKAFSKLPQRVLWKYENESLPEQPTNVMIQKWMPQFDILCHPNVKAFIAHGGLLGTTEAVHCGVPMIIMPQYGDQFLNSKAVEANGGGIILDFNTLNEKTIYDALKTVLEPSFNKKSKEISAAFRDRPLPPLDTAIYWVEYIARHHGAPFMRTKAVGMPLYKYLLLDVIGFLLVVFLALMAVLFYCLKFVAHMVLGKPKKIKSN